MFDTIHYHQITPTYDDVIRMQWNLLLNRDTVLDEGDEDELILEASVIITSIESITLYFLAWDLKLQYPLYERRRRVESDMMEIDMVLRGKITVRYNVF